MQSALRSCVRTRSNFVEEVVESAEEETKIEETKTNPSRQDQEQEQKPKKKGGEAKSDGRALPASQASWTPSDDWFGGPEQFRESPFTEKI